MLDVELNEEYFNYQDYSDSNKVYVEQIETDTMAQSDRQKLFYYRLMAYVCFDIDIYYTFK